MTKDSGRTLPSADHPVKQPIAPVAGQSTRFRKIAATCGKIFSAWIDGAAHQIASPRVAPPSCAQWAIRTWKPVGFEGNRLPTAIE